MAKGSGRGGGGGKDGPLEALGAAWAARLGAVEGGRGHGALEKALSRAAGSRRLVKTMPCTGSPSW